MYTIKRDVKKVTLDMLKEADKIVPGILTHKDFPVVENQNQAKVEALNIANKQLERSREWASRTTDIIETPTGWTVTIVILGD